MSQNASPRTVGILAVAMVLTMVTEGPTAAQDAPPQPITVAVLDFVSGEELAPDTGSKVSALLNTLLSTKDALYLVERAELDKLMGEQELGLSGVVTKDSAAALGRLTGAKVLVTGKIFVDGARRVAVAKIMGVETGRVFGEIAQQEEAGTLEALAEELAGKLAHRITQQSQVLMAKVVPKEDRIARLLESLPRGERPTVAVILPERHFGQRVIDPAAATELMVLLEKAGFGLVDEASNRRPDIEIKGEAFSAFAMRKGNLISCKARIEIRIRDVNRDQVLAVDRQTSVAVDITEQTAAKNALENGALALAERNLATLLK